jgi:hypothetical protein
MNTITIKKIVTLFLLFLSLPFIAEGEDLKIRVFSTGYRGSIIPTQRIVIKEFGEYKTCYNQYYMGRCDNIGDTILLHYEYDIDRGEISPIDTIALWKTYQYFISRNDNIHDCTEYEIDSMIIDNDTIWIGNEWRESYTHFEEMKYAPITTIDYSGEARYSPVSILYPKKGTGVLLLMFYSSHYFFEHYFPELDESLIGLIKKKKNRITLYPMYIQRFNKNGELEYERVSKTKKIKFISKGYTLKRVNSASYPFSKKYDRQKMVSSEVPTY